jgi:hypothetical protein
MTAEQIQAMYEMTWSEKEIGEITTDEKLKMKVVILRSKLLYVPWITIRSWQLRLQHGHIGDSAYNMDTAILKSDTKRL